MKLFSDSQKTALLSYLAIFSLCTAQNLFAQPNQIYCELQVKNLGSLQQIEVAFEIARLSDTDEPTAIEAEYEILSNGKILEEKKLPIIGNVEKINSTFYYNFLIERVTEPDATLKVTIIDLAANVEVSKSISLEVPNKAVSFGLKNQSNPLNSSYVRPGESLIMKSASQKPIFLVRFEHSFLPAAPPMGNNMSAGGPGLRVDSVIVVNTNTPFSLGKEALYFAQEDTTTVNGIGFRVVSEDYPKFKQVENLAQSMIYIATNKEINGFLSAADQKAALDNFWLNTGGSVGIAKALIKEYYQRVTYSNKNFTNYKEGWKTDRGIIYIVFGRPNEVANLPNGQQWVYFLGKKRKRVTFEFKRKPNIFSGFHYELFRSPRYKKVYYEAVEKWRKGEIILP